MSDLKGIANKHLESAGKLQEGAAKYIIGFGLLILFCWIFTERVFYKTKFDAIRLNMLEVKVDSLRYSLSEKYNKEIAQTYSALQEKEKSQDSVSSETYKAVEDNLPQAFKFILRQATHKPFGIILTALTTICFLWYMYDLRKRYLRKLAVGLRILKEEDNGYNKIYDYNVAIPFWAFPLWKKESKGICRDDVAKVAGLMKGENSLTILTGLILTGILVIQGRLFYISLITNSHKQHWILVVQSIVLCITIAMILIWILPVPFNNLYNNEKSENDPASRRNAIILLSSLAVGSLLGYWSQPVSKSIVSAMLRPRIRTKKRVKKISECRRIEQDALKMIKDNNWQQAADLLFKTIGKKENHARLKEFTRLFDLLILLCYKNNSIYKAKFKSTIIIARQSNEKGLVSKSKSWEKHTAKLARFKSTRTHWDKAEL